VVSKAKGSSAKPPKTKAARPAKAGRAAVVVEDPAPDAKRPEGAADRIKLRMRELVAEGWKVYVRFIVEFLPEQAKSIDKETLQRAGTKSFSISYQTWYSEALRLLKQTLPERVADFENLYRPTRARKEVDFENYTISDALLGLQTSFGGQIKVEPKKALTRVQLQVQILESARRAIESDLYDLRTLLQAELLDNEIVAAEELVRKGFLRASGVIVGVVIESHLGKVAAAHAVTIKSNAPTIATFNDALKAADVIDVVTWRRIQAMADVRNTCGHSRTVEPTREEVERLIADAKDIIKRVA